MIQSGHSAIERDPIMNSKIQWRETKPTAGLGTVTPQEARLNYPSVRDREPEGYSLDAEDSFDIRDLLLDDEND
jgi:hypothetical protein